MPIVVRGVLVPVFEAGNLSKIFHPITNSIGTNRHVAAEEIRIRWFSTQVDMTEEAFLARIASLAIKEDQLDNAIHIARVFHYHWMQVGYGWIQY